MAHVLYAMSLLASSEKSDNGTPLIFFSFHSIPKGPKNMTRYTGEVPILLAKNPKNHAWPYISQ